MIRSFLCLLSVGILASVAGAAPPKTPVVLHEEGAKVHPTVYMTPADVQRARENRARFPWAGETAEALIRDADVWLQKDDAWFRNAVPSAGAAFAYGFTGCPICGAGWGTWMAANASFDNPGHVTCANGHVLPDAEHPDPGTGYVGKDGRIHYMVGSYNAWAIETLTFKALGNLTAAYTLTGDEKYADKAVVIMDAIANVYPEDTKGSWDYPSNPPSGRLSRPWYQVSRVLVHFTDFYDQLFNSPSLNRPSITNGLSRRQNIETNLLKNGAAYCYEQSLAGGLNNGEADYVRGVLAVGVCLGIPEYVKWATDGPYGIYSLLENNIDRDGGYYETSIGYAGHTRDLYFTFAEPLLNYRGSAYPNGVNLYEHPKFRRFLTLHNLAQKGAGHAPPYGDGTPITEKKIASERPFDLNDYMMLERLHARTTGTAQKEISTMLHWLAEGDIEKVRGTFPVTSTTGGFDMRKWLLFHAPPTDASTKDAPLSSDMMRQITGSNFLGQKGIGVLRTGSGENSQALLMRFGPSLNHGHFDDLNINYFARGYELTYDIGYGLGSTHTQVGWAVQTASHNLVVVDETSQLLVSTNPDLPSGSGGSLHLFAHMPGAKIIEASSNGSYAAQGVSQYRRTLALIGEGADAYALDLFRVHGGKQHDYMFHALGTNAKFSGVEFGPIAKGSLAGEKYEWGNKQLNDGDMEGHPEKPYWNPPPGNGYGFLVQPQRAKAKADGVVSADWTIDDGTHLRLMMPQSDNEILTAVAPGLYPTTGFGARRALPKARYVVSRRKGENLSSEFIAAIEPYGDAPKITNIERLPLQAEAGSTPGVEPIAVKVTRADGVLDYVFSSGDEIARQADNITFAGRFAHARVKDGKLISFAATGAKEFAGFGWKLAPQIAHWNGEIAKLDTRQNFITTNAPLPTDKTLVGQPIIFSGADYSRTTAYRIERIEADGAARRIYLDGTMILGKGQIESIPDGNTLVNSIPHEYARTVRRIGDSNFFQGKTIRATSGAHSQITGTKHGSPMTLSVKNAQNFKVGDVFFYEDLQPGNSFEILSDISISQTKPGTYRYNGIGRTNIAPPKNVKKR